MEWLNYHHLLYFWVVAKEGTIAAACKELNLAQPTISAQIRVLEDSLGEKLFSRVGRNLALTETGRVVYRYADEIFSLGRDLMDTLKGRPSGRPLRLNVGVADVLPKLVAYRLLEPAFQLPEPVQLVCHEGSPAVLLTRLATYELDLVLSDSPIGPEVKGTKTEFLANMSHELRTPLNAIIGFSEVIENEILGKADSNPKYVGYARDINSAGEHLLNVINDILDIAKIEVGRLELDEEVFDLDNSFDSCVKMLAEHADKSGVVLTRATPAPLPNFKGDEKKFKQIVLNLLSNAIKFTPKGGSVTLEAGVEENGALRVAVADTGIGIAPEDQAKVMAPFMQVESAQSRKYEGTGLGLPISQALAELHGGKVSMSSKLGAGTTITLLFPASRTERAPDVQAAPAAVRLAG